MKLMGASLNQHTLTAAGASAYMHPFAVYLESRAMDDALSYAHLQAEPGGRTQATTLVTPGQGAHQQ